MSIYINQCSKRKRTSIENQFRDGVQAPPKIVDHVKPVAGCSEFIVPSSTSDKSYIVKIGVTGRCMNYTCTCTSAQSPESKFIACKHIRAVVIFMMIDLIKKNDQTSCDMSACSDILKMFTDLNIDNVDILD